MRYRVNAGLHQQVEMVPDPSDPTGKRKIREEHTYNAGQVFETDMDMLAFNGAGMTPKFVRLDEEPGRLHSTPRLDPDNPPPGWAYVGGDRIPYGEVSAPPGPQQAPPEDRRPISKLPPESVVATIPEALRGPAQGQPHETTQNMPLTIPPVPPTQERGDPRSGPPPQGKQSAVPPRNSRDYVAHLDRMSEQELREHAAEEEIDLKGAKTKADIVKVLKAQR
jgi:hypothetical protein